MVQADSLKKQILIIGGPTAIGKSALAVKIALRYGGEVVSADSMQIYRGMDVGTGKITVSEMQGVPHHMLDFAEPTERYSVGRYVIEAETAIAGIHARHKLPIVVGGTGLYINALINGLNFSDAQRSDEVREKWKAILCERGAEYVYAYLKKIDAASAEKISPNDHKRVIRAIEIYEVTGIPKSMSAKTVDCKYNYKFIVLDCPRETLYGRINARVDDMFAKGFYDEATKIRQRGECTSMQAIGYKQINDYLDGKFVNIQDAIEEIKKSTRNYAKRQMTFFRGMKAEKVFIDPTDEYKIYAEIDAFLTNGDVYGN